MVTRRYDGKLFAAKMFFKDTVLKQKKGKVVLYQIIALMYIGILIQWDSYIKDSRPPWGTETLWGSWDRVINIPDNGTTGRRRAIHSNKGKEILFRKRLRSIIKEDNWTFDLFTWKEYHA